MDVDAIYEILGKTCHQLRKGEVVEGAGSGVLEVFMMPKNDDPAFDSFEKVDLHFVTVAVDKAAAEAECANLIALLDQWPEPDLLAGGPSYIGVGGVLGDQGAAFELFALGKVLGIWDVITPEVFGFTGEEARDVAGKGLILITGYRKP